MCFNQRGGISTLKSGSLKLVYKFTCPGSSVSLTENDIDTRIAKAWTDIDRLSVIWKSDLTDKIKRSFFQAAVVLVLQYGCTSWTLTKCMEKKLDSNYTRMLRAVLNKSWRQHSTKQQLYGYLQPITKTIHVRRTRYAGHCWRNKDEPISDVLLWISSHGRGKVESIYNSFVPIQNVAWRTFRDRQTIETGGERWSGKSVLAARHDGHNNDGMTL